MSTRPRVVTYSVASLDGRMTVAPGTLLLQGDERWSEVAGTAGGYERVRARYAPEATLEGSGSFVVEGDEPGPLPEPAGPVEGLYEDYFPAGVVERPGHAGWFMVVDGRGRIRWAYKEWPDEAWRGWHLLVLAARSTPAGYLAYLREEGIPYLVVGEERVDLAAALARMGEQLGVKTVLSTAGGRLSGALLRAGLVDEVVIEFVPALIGGRGTPALFDAERPVQLGMISVEPAAGASAATPAPSHTGVRLRERAGVSGASSAPEYNRGNQHDISIRVNHGNPTHSRRALCRPARLCLRTPLHRGGRVSDTLCGRGRR